MIDIEQETLLTVPQAAKRIPGRPSIATVWRWVLSGVGAGKLESVLIGGRRFTSAEAIQRFVERCSAGGEQPSVRTARQRDIAIRRAERELRDAGI